ncbi:O-antigen ligase family protein [Streptomyces halstedii]|uniref:O-antigen ligase family protein n=1 Tax=Streptomyces TaxID=1883 RepID=UPI0004A93DF2|nr:O-antigen ligase family protein [Streptomyces sp. NTK 937]KDQ65467.1 membrane protein [Streptomyces sp. NTK 937]WSX39731.1 O-antigen ligase family protein [Streptomyces halstedii]
MTLTAFEAPTALPRTAPAASAAGPADRGTRRAGWPLLPLVAAVLLPAVPADAVAAWTGYALPLADLASGVAVLVCVGVLLFRRRRPLPPAAAFVLALPVVGLAVATVTATDPVAALPGFARYLQIFVLVPAAVLLLVRDAADFRVVTGALVLSALVQGVVGAHQYATGTGASYMGEDIRAVGTFGPEDVMGMATVVGYGLLAAGAYAFRPAAGRPAWWVPCALGVTAALVVPLALSFSRGAWIATAAGGAVMIAATGARQALRTLAVLVACAVVLVGGFGVGSQMLSQRLTSITQVTSAPDRSVTDRYSMWAAAAGMWRERPVTGVGLKAFPAHRDGQASIGLSAGSDTAGAGQEFVRQPLLSPHNMYLLVLGEQGLVGFVALVGGWAALLVGGVYRLARARSRRAAALDCGLAAVGLTVWQCVDFLYADIGGPSTVLTGVVLGLAAWWALAAPEKAAAA